MNVTEETSSLSSIYYLIHTCYALEAFWLQPNQLRKFTLSSFLRTSGLLFDLAMINWTLGHVEMEVVVEESKAWCRSEVTIESQANTIAKSRMDFRSNISSGSKLFYLFNNGI
ncbi:hypothetical protein K438DRAFT_1750347 [Mycena galopus ATCC 62051]|nr:hypothetical protein K438DRAFT_1750347 [Mycena galopus ATCC 62051]